MCRLNLRPLQTSVSKFAREWVLMLGEYLHNGSKELSKDFNKKVTVIWKISVEFDFLID